MEISNKILLGFLILVFATPVFLFMSFRNKIKKGEFTVTKTHIPYYNESAIKSNGSIKPFKVLKIVDLGREGVFSCNIIPASSATYEYTNFGNTGVVDSISLKQKGDTLLIIYMGTWINGVYGNTNLLRNLCVTLYLPVIKNIIIERANIFIDSVNTTSNPEIYFDLSKKASLTLGRWGTATTLSPHFAGKVAPNKLNKSSTTPFTVIENSSGQFNKLFIRTTNSNVSFGSLAWIKDLDLQMLGLSKISVDDQCRISQLNGIISDSATIEANWKNIRRFATIKGK